MATFRNLKSAENIGSGVADYLLIAPVSYFTSIAEAPLTSITPGGEVVIVNDHVFKPGMGFIQINLAPFKNEFNAKTIGDKGSLKLEQTFTVFIPGSYPQLHETFQHLLNIPVIALLKDANCAADLHYQLGSDCVYAYVSGDFGTGTTRDGVKGYNVSITFTKKFIQLYEGSIIVNPTAPLFLAALSDTNIAGNVTVLHNFFLNALSIDIDDIYDTLLAYATDNIIQLSYANNNGQAFSEVILDFDLSSVEDFIIQIQEWIAANGSGQSVELEGSQLIITDETATSAYFGIAICQPLGNADDDYVLADDNNILLL